MENVRESFNRVRAIVNARIAERDAGECECDVSRRCMLCADIATRRKPTHLMSDLPVVEGALVRLPENLRVPSPEPRPPNLNAACLSFAARVVIAVRDRFGGDAPKVYAAAKVTRQAYSQIVSDETHTVSKRTAVRFAFALRCDVAEARALLKSAGYAFSNSLTEDFILQACLEVNPPIWDLDAVNELLREYRVDFQY